MGVGMVVAVEAGDAGAVLDQLPGAWRIGEVVAREADEPAVSGLAP
jgi:phosphoribosylaminoimidazole (AIR) synthetase